MPDERSVLPASPAFAGNVERVPAASNPSDVFGTEERRHAVLDAWVGSPTRFREDANAEEDLLLGGYADRVLVELAQNAADAAARAGVEGVLRLRLADGVLSAANTGAPLDAAGVDSLTSLRASAKRDTGGVGRFGVGFAAVLAVSDEPEVRSLGGGVGFSAVATRQAAAELGGVVAAEAARRAGRVPVLRLAWPVDAAPPEGFATEVRLPLRDGAGAAVGELLAALDPTLLLGLPALTRVEIGDRVIERHPADVGDTDVVLADGGVRTRWRCARAGGDVPAELLLGRPVEESSTWSVLAAVPVDEAGEAAPLAGPGVVHAPTPSDEPLSLALRLAVSYPLEPSRRRVAPGPLTDWLTGRAADAVAALVSSVAPTPAALGLVPRPGLAHAPLDAALCTAVLTRLRETPLLPTVRPAGEPRPAADDIPAGWEPGPATAATDHGGDDRRVLGRDARVPGPDLVDVAPRLVPVLAGVVPGLLPPPYAGRAHIQALDALGVGRLEVADVVGSVAGLDRPPAWWRDLYAALADLGPRADRDALAALPVPLADGRTVTGARGTLLPDEGLPAGAVGVLGLRVVHPDAAHPLLERLGAQPATPRSALTDDRVRAAVEHSADAEDPTEVADAVLALVAAAGVQAGAEPWLGDLALPGTDGDWYPAAELVVPGSPLAAVLAADAPFGTLAREVLDVHGQEVVAAVGCLSAFAVLDASEVDLADVDDLDLDQGDAWADAVADLLGDAATGARIEQLRAVRDLEYVRPDAWPQALAALATGVLRPLLAAPAHAVLADGRRVEVPAYARWWLADEPVLDGHRPGDLRTPNAWDLVGLYETPDTGVDPEFLALLGCRTGLADVLAAGDAADLLDRLGDPARSAPAAVVPLIYARIAVALEDAALAGTPLVRPDPPARVRVSPDRVVDAATVVVVDQPWRLSEVGDREPILGGADPLAVAELLDVPVLSEL